MDNRKRPGRLIFPVLFIALAFQYRALAATDIDELVEQTGIREHGEAVRDRPGWQGARKILYRDIGIDTAQLERPGIELIVVESQREAMRHIEDADAIAGFCDAELVAAGTKLVWIQIFSAGAEHCLAVDRVGSGDIVLTNMQKMSSPVIAEHAIALMLALGRRVPQFVAAMREQRWDRGRGSTDGMRYLAGKNLLVVGLGGIGTEVARLGSALGMSVNGTRNSSREGPDFVEYVGLSHELNSLAAGADVIVNALPLTDATAGLLDAGFFGAAKDGAIFINVGRGKTVVTEALVDALESGQLSGAGLDVTDPEPLPADHPLWAFENVIITPHVASRGGERERHAALLTENLRRYMDGGKLLNVVDPEQGY